MNRCLQETEIPEWMIQKELKKKKKKKIRSQQL